MDFDFEKERKFEIEKVSPIWLVTALCVVPFSVYFLLNFLSPLIHRLTAMKVSEVCFTDYSRILLLTSYKIYVYPIKSLRPVKVKEALATRFGFQHDRKILLPMVKLQVL